MTDLILDQFRRLVGGLDPRAPWPALTQSGFLDLLRPEDEDGAGLDLAGLFPLVIELGRQPAAPAIAETIVARLVSPDAIDCRDPYVDGPRATRVFWSDRIACIHMSGLLVRSFGIAGQDGFRGGSPNS